MGKITIDLDDGHTFFALSQSLSEWSAELRDRADRGEPNAEMFGVWADTADQLVARIEDAHKAGQELDAGYANLAEDFSEIDAERRTARDRYVSRSEPDEGGSVGR